MTIHLSLYQYVINDYFKVYFNQLESFKYCVMKYLLKLICGYVPYSDWGLVEFRLGNVQKNALASKEAICN